MRALALVVLAAAAPNVVVQRTAPVTLGRAPVAIRLDVAHVRARLLAGARSPSQTVFLRLDGVEAARQPGAVWKVYLGAVFVGNVALYGAGIGKATTLTFAVDRPLTAALKPGVTRLPFRFVETGPRVPAATVRIARVGLAIEPSR